VGWQFAETALRTTRRAQAGFSLRYTFTIVKKLLNALLVISFATGLSAAEETSFNRVRMPNTKGKEIKALLTFSDNDKAIEVRPKKGQSVAVPYSEIDKCTYEYTESLSLLLRSSKTHWLQVDYRDHDAHRILVLRLHKGNYIRVLDALKTHTGMDAELFGNANKRRGDLFAKH